MNNPGGLQPENGRKAWQNITAATAWDSPFVSAFDQLAAAVIAARCCAGWPKGCAVECLMDQRTFDCVRIDAPPGGLCPTMDPPGNEFAVVVPEPTTGQLTTLATIVEVDGGKPGRVVIRKPGHVMDVWVQAL